MSATRWSVVIPCRNAEATIERQLRALYHQDLAEPFEVIVADNGSTDRSAEIARSWRGRLPALRVLAASSPGANAARNVGGRGAAGELLAFCDADDEADPSWLRALSEGFAEGYDLVGGSLDWTQLNPDLPPSRQRLQVELSNSLGFLPWAQSANLAMRRQVFDQLGGFDESYSPGCDEVDFQWRAQMAGFRLGATPGAVMHYATRRNARATFRQFVSYGRGHVRLYRQFAPHGMTAPPARAVIGRWWWLAKHAPLAVRPGEDREAVARRGGLAVGRALASIRMRTFYL
jgi:glycosyltransferase involved in cell wall biosynthesis